MKGIQLENYNKIRDDTIYSNSRQATISASENYDLSIPLDEQLSKMSVLIPTLEDEPTVIFCFYVKRGISFIKQVLEHYGYEEWGSENEKKKCAVISGETENDTTKKILDAFNSITNIHGKENNILIGSSVLHESITLFRVAKVHILSPFWNYGHVEQSVGRVKRHNSHVGVKNKKVDIYLHAAENSVDIKMWETTFNKKELIDKKIKEEKDNENIIKLEDEINYPEPDNIKIFRHEDKIWDFTECFDSNKFCMSWCKIYDEKAVCYDLVKNEKNNYKYTI